MYIFFFAVHPLTPVSVDQPTFLENSIFVLWGDQEVFDGFASFEMYLYVIFGTDVFATFTNPFGVWHNYMVFSLLICAELFLVLLEHWNCCWCTCYAFCFSSWSYLEPKIFNLVVTVSCVLPFSIILRGNKQSWL